MPREVELGRVEDFSAGKFSIVTVDGREFGVTRLPSGEFRVIRNACPHKGARICAGIVGGTWPPSDPGTIEYAMEGEVLLCPWHGIEYNLNDGKPLFSDHPGSGKLRLFPVQVKDGLVFATI